MPTRSESTGFSFVDTLNTTQTQCCFCTRQCWETHVDVPFTEVSRSPCEYYLVACIYKHSEACCSFRNLNRKLSWVIQVLSKSKIYLSVIAVRNINFPELLESPYFYTSKLTFTFLLDISIICVKQLKHLYIQNCTHTVHWPLQGV
jgi:hypothetical protein